MNDLKREKLEYEMSQPPKQKYKIRATLVVEEEHEIEVFATSREEALNLFEPLECSEETLCAMGSRLVDDIITGVEEIDL